MAKKSKQTINKASLGLLNVLGDFYKGKFLSIEFFKKNFIYIIFAMGMIVMYIANKYTNMSYQSEKIKLENQLREASTDWVTAKMKFNSLTRESNMKQYMDSMHIDLTSPEQPPYNLSTK